jgi:hypothetical protein
MSRHFDIVFAGDTIWISSTPQRADIGRVAVILFG